jgi:hypothetical protein
MKIINLFKSVLLTFSFTFFFYFNSLAFTLVETPIALDAAWGMTWIDDEQMLITQKSGEVFLVNSLITLKLRYFMIYHLCNMVRGGF